MKGIAIVFTVFLICVSCIRHKEKSTNIESINFVETAVDIQYAKGFEVSYHPGYIKLITKSIQSNHPFRDSLFVITKENIKIDPALKSIYVNDLKLACQSSTYLAYINQLRAIEQVNALCGIQYVNNDSIKQELLQQDVIELCQTDQVQAEALFKANPDLFLIYPFGSIQDLNYDKRGIPTLLIGEYLEETQLARLEWIKLFGILLNRVEEANQYFDRVAADYQRLKSDKLIENNSFIMNLPFQDQWFMPSSSSVGVQLIEDAGLTYFYQDDLGTENQIHTKEAVWDAGTQVDYWIIITRRDDELTLAKLIEEEPVYQTFKSVKNNKVLYCNTAKVDYFAKGTIEPDVILKDLLFLTGQIENHTPVYFELLN